MARYTDWDAALAEAAADPVTFRLFGRDWHVREIAFGELAAHTEAATDPETSMDAYWEFFRALVVADEAEDWAQACVATPAVVVLGVVRAVAEEVAGTPLAPSLTRLPAPVSNGALSNGASVPLAAPSP